jgi:probable HAF family extracellular repeat protein
MKAIMNLATRTLHILAFFVSFTATGHAFTQTYSLTALPLTQGVTRPYVIGINDLGTVIGLSLDEPKISFQYANGKYSFIEPSTTQSNYVNDINNRGSSVGTAYSGGRYLGFIYNPLKTVTFDGAPGALETDAESINDVGQVVGYFRPAGFPLETHDHIFIRQANGTFTDLGDFGYYPSALINNQGMVVVSAAVSPELFARTYVYQPGFTKNQVIPALAPGGSVGALSINQLGVIAGYAYDAQNLIEHAFVYTNGRTIDLGTLPAVGANPGDQNSQADSINIFGQIVGFSAQYSLSTNRVPNPGYNHGFIYSGGVMRDLNSLLPTSANGWVINDAVSINDLGEIAALATYQGGTQTSVILKPSGILPRSN